MHETVKQEIINIQNLTPNLLTNFYLFFKADYPAGGNWFIHDPNAARRISC